MPFIGGDLTAMAALARRFAAAGAAFRADTDGITRCIAGALDELTLEMAQLDRDARQLGAEIDAQLVALRDQAAATAWTGRRRDEQDHFIDALGTDIRGVRASIDAFADEASAMVGGALTTTIGDMRTHVELTGAQAQAVAEGFGTAVEQQRAAFDAVMNG